MQKLISGFLALLFINAGSLYAQTAVGQFAGSLDVNLNGQATYTIPIKGGKGIGSFAPAVALVYSSGATEGIAGYGWSLSSGGSAISRSGRTTYYNGITRPTQGDGKDNFYLDGELLIPTTGNNGANGTVYTTHGETFIKAESFGSTEGNPGWWRVTQKDGTIVEYGKNTADVYKTAAGLAMQWLATDIADVSGNKISYVYVQNEEEITLYEIQYAGNTIRFEYTTKETPSLQFVKGGRIKASKLLKYIKIIQDNTTYNTYELNYSNTLKHHYLSSISVTGTDGSSKMSNSFNYGVDLNTEEKVEKEVIAVDYGRNHVPIVGDFDGNGFADMIFMEQTATVKDGKEITKMSSSEYKYIADYGNTSGSRPSTTKTFTQTDYDKRKSGISPSPLSLYGADYDGKAKDVFLRSTRIKHVYYDTKGCPHEDEMDYVDNMQADRITVDANKTASVSSSDLGIPKDANWRVHDFYLKEANSIVEGDFNGDGKVDILSIMGNKYQWATTTEKRFGNVVNQIPHYAYNYKVFFTNTSDGYYHAEVLNIGAEIDTTTKAVYAINFNDDARQELLVLGNSSCKIYAIDEISAASGYLFAATLLYSSSVFGSGNSFDYYSGFIPGDYNGDGKTDFFCPYNKDLNAHIFYATGEGFVKTTINLMREDVERVTHDAYISGDFNGDGISDIYHDYRRLESYSNLGSRQHVYYFKGLSYSQYRAPKETDMCESDFHAYFKEEYPDAEIVKYYSYECPGFDSGNAWEESSAPSPYCLVEYDYGSVLTETYIPYYTTVQGGHDTYRGVVSGYNIGGFLQADLRGNNTLGVINYKGGIGGTFDYLTFGSSSKPKLLQSITDNLGNQTSINYESISKIGSTAYKKSETAENIYPINICNIPLTVVSSVSRPNGIGSTTAQTYNYANAVLHRTKGFLGFKQTTVSDNIGNKAISDQVVNSTYGLLLPQSVKTYINNVQVAEQTTTFSISSYPSGVTGNYIANRIKALPSQVVSKDLLKGITAIASYLGYDAYNNLKSEKIDYGGGLSVETTREYYNNITSPYRIGLPTSETATRYRDGTSWVSSSTISYTADARRLPEAIVEKANANEVSEIKYTYDSWGNMLTKTAEAFNSGTFLGTTYTYTANGRYPATETNALSQKTTFAEYNFYGKPRTATDFKNNITTYSYDAWGRAATVSRPDGVTESASYSWASGNNAKYSITQSATNQPTSISYYDALGRGVKNSTQRFDNSYLHMIIKYNINGQKIFEGRPSKTDNTTTGTSYEYDSYERLKTMTAPNGNKTEYSYSANTVTETANKIATTKSYDAMGSLIKVNDPGGTITYALRPDGQPTSITLPNVTVMDGSTPATVTVVTKFEYDQYGRQTKIIDPGAGTKSFGYDKWGNINSETDANGKIISSTYDEYGRITGTTMPEFNTSYTYYTEGWLQEEKSTNGTAKYFEYDGLGRTTYVKETSSGGAWVWQFITYAAGRQKTIEYNNIITGYMNSETYAYTNGHHTKTTLDNNVVVYELKEENDMGITKKINTGPIARQYDFDANGLPIGRSAAVGTASPFMNFKYSFDPLTGNLNSREDKTRSLTESFLYDDQNRLKNYGNQSVTYGLNGNIETKGDVGSYYYRNKQKPNALTGIVQTGTAIPQRQQLVSYTSFSRPQTISENGYEAKLQYNAAGERVQISIKQNGSFVYGATYLGGRYEFAPRGNYTAHRVYIGGDYYSAIAVYEKPALHLPAKLYYLHRDHLGSITHITDADGKLTNEYSYDAWGRLRNPTDWKVYDAASQPALAFGRGYTGHEHLPQFGLINMNARLYDPVHGRMLAPDPYVQNPTSTQSYNRFSYVWNNPLKYTDLTGELTSEEFGYILNRMMQSDYGGYWNSSNPSSIGYFTSSGEAFGAGVSYMNAFNSWGSQSGWAASTYEALGNYNGSDGVGGHITADMVKGYYRNHWAGQYYNVDAANTPSGKGFNIVRTTSPTTTMDNSIHTYSSYQKMERIFAGQGGGGGAMAAALGFAGTASLADGPLPFGEILGVVAIAGTAAYVYGPALVDKMNKEISGIMQRVAGPPGFQYALTATRSGLYPNVNGGTTMLNVGDVWKYGETTKGEGRYTKDFYNGVGLRMVPQFFGNQMEIKIQEKIMIYGYFMGNGSLPPGNSIFR